jgi:hypothetical protein
MVIEVLELVGTPEKKKKEKAKPTTKAEVAKKVAEKLPLSTTPKTIPEEEEAISPLTNPNYDAPHLQKKQKIIPSVPTQQEELDDVDFLMGGLKEILIDTGVLGDLVVWDCCCDDEMSLLSSVVAHGCKTAIASFTNAPNPLNTPETLKKITFNVFPLQQVKLETVGLIITCPPSHFIKEVSCFLFHSKKPFAILLPAELMMSEMIKEFFVGLSESFIIPSAYMDMFWLVGHCLQIRSLPFTTSLRYVNPLKLAPLALKEPPRVQEFSKDEENLINEYGQFPYNNPKPSEDIPTGDLLNLEAV